MERQQLKANKVILITGTSRSIGKFIARYYLQKGCFVIGCSRGASDLKMENYYHYCLDVADEMQVIRMFSEIRRKFQCLDVLINNAGVYAAGPAAITSMKVVEETFKTNVFGTYLFCREAYKLMMNKKSGNIINITSVAVPLCSVGTSVYGSSKAAVEHLSKVLAKEFQVANVNVNALGFSIVDESGMASSMGKLVMAQTLEQTVSKSMVSFDDIVQAIDRLLAEPGKGVTGQFIYLGM